MDYTRYVQQLANGRWIVAYWVAKSGQWIAPMTKLESKLTGCSSYFARTLEGLDGTTYSTKSNALRAAHSLIEPDYE